MTLDESRLPRLFVEREALRGNRDYRPTAHGTEKLVSPIC